MNPEKYLVKSYKIKKSEYSHTAASTANECKTTQTLTTKERQLLSQNFDLDKDGQVVLKDYTNISEFLFGANLPIDIVMNLILNQLGKIVDQIPNTTMHEALGQSIMIRCADAAKMDSLSNVNKHVTSFSIVPAS